MIRRLTGLFVLLAGLSICGAAFAQAVDPSQDPQGALGQFWAAVTGHKWGIASAVGAMLLVSLVRFVAPKLHDKFGDWVLSSRVSAGLALISGLLMSVASQLIKGGPMSMSVLAYGFTAGVAAIGGYNAFWDLFFPNDTKKPEAKPDNAGPINVDPPSPPPPVRAGAMLPFIAMPLLGLLGAASVMGCDCWQAAHVQEPKCIIAHDIVECAEGDAADAVAIAGAILTAVVDLGSGIPTTIWDTVKQMAITLGFKTGGCFWAKLQEYFNMPGASPGRMAAASMMSTHMRDFKSHFGTAGVKFCFTNKAGSRVCK